MNILQRKKDVYYGLWIDVQLFKEMLLLYVQIMEYRTLSIEYIDKVKEKGQTFLLVTDTKSCAPQIIIKYYYNNWYI